MDHLQSQHLLVKLLVTATRDSHLTVLALATLGDVTQMAHFYLDRVTQGGKATTLVTVVCGCR